MSFRFGFNLYYHFESFSELITVVKLSFRCQISTETFLHMRYDGTDCALICNVSPCQVEEVFQSIVTCDQGYCSLYSLGLLK